MDPTLAIAIGFVLLLILLFSGLPIFLALGLTGLTGIYLIEGPALLASMGHMIWGSLFKWSLLAVPGFVFMGSVLFHHEFGADLFDTTYKWLGRLPGGLLIASTTMCALFGFISGSAMAGVATIGSIAIPEVEKRDYDRRLSLGAFTIGGTLAALIPPSILMIIYAIMAEVSLGALFFAGIIPGLLLAFLICGYTFLRATINPKLCPPGPTFTWNDKFKALAGLVPVIILFLVVLGGIYMGIWSAIEAASVGAMFGFLICLVYGRVTWTKLKASLNATVAVCAMVYMILVGAAFLNHFIYLGEVNEMLNNLVVNLNLPRVAVVVFILLIMTVLGCILDVMALIMLSIPVFLPIMENLGYDLVWFGIIIIVECELALVTPPVGVNLYIIKGLVTKDTTMMDIIMGVLPYIFVVWVFFMLLLLFPEIALWLPSTMRH